MVQKLEWNFGSRVIIYAEENENLDVLTGQIAVKEENGLFMFKPNFMRWSWAGLNSQTADQKIK